MNSNGRIVSEMEMKGPISLLKEKTQYLEDHRIPQIYSSLLAALMVERPRDHLEYLNEKLEVIKQVDAYRIDWDTFVYDLHPHRQKSYLNILQDEYTEKIKRLMQMWLSQHDYLNVFRLTQIEDEEDNNQTVDINGNTD